MSNNTLEYYDKQCAAFVASTVHVDFAVTQNKFIDRLTKHAHILDFGCGSGRDTKYFLGRGFKVTAVDGSAELCKFASEYTGLAVKQMYFQDLDDVAVYDGIWACSSILHLSYAELQDVFNKMVLAVKEGGIIYTSFKYGTFEGERAGRSFTDMNEEKLENFLKPVTNIKIEELWVSGDVRQGRGDEKWLNVILRKGAIEDLKVEADGLAHTAFDDAYNTGKVLQKMLEQGWDYNEYRTAYEESRKI